MVLHIYASIAQGSKNNLHINNQSKLRNKIINLGSISTITRKSMDPIINSRYPWVKVGLYCPKINIVSSSHLYSGIKQPRQVPCGTHPSHQGQNEPRHSVPREAPTVVEEQVLHLRPGLASKRFKTLQL